MTDKEQAGAGGPAPESTIAAANADAPAALDPAAVAAADVSAAETAKRALDVKNRLGNPNGPPVAVDQVVMPGEETVTMNFPRAVILTLDNHVRISFKLGVQEVPARLADHWYLAASGATRYTGSQPKEATK